MNFSSVIARLMLQSCLEKMLLSVASSAAQLDCGKNTVKCLVFDVLCLCFNSLLFLRTPMAVAGVEFSPPFVCVSVCFFHTISPKLLQLGLPNLT